jgi:hypothetical protein
VSVAERTVRAMSDGRRRRRAKQARRDTRRTKARERRTREEALFAEVIREALNGAHPLGLLSLASIVIRMTVPDPFPKWGSQKREPIDMDYLIGSLTREPSRETTALLAVLTELMVGEKDRQDRCRREVAAQNYSLPESISRLAQIRPYRAVRATHVLGDEDELLVGAELVGGYELTCVVHINHNMFSEVDDAYFVPDSIDKVLAGAIERNNDPDVSFVDMSLADARAWIDHGLERALFPIESGSWPHCRPLVEWLVTHLPEGGVKFETPEWDWASLSKLVRSFFASRSGAWFKLLYTEELLQELIESGSGDPLRWSAARIARVLDGTPFYDEHVPLMSVLEIPELLRAFVPFAHSQSGIRDELTAKALAVIDEKGPVYRRAVLEKAEYWE